MNNKFILNYQGNKYKETQHLKDINYDDYDVIIETFGGSFGFSRYLYEILGLKKKLYIIYDINKELIDFYNFLKNNDINVFLNEYNNHNKTIFELFTTNKDKSQIKRKETLEWIKKNISCNNMSFFLIHNITNSYITRVYNKSKVDFIDFIKNAYFIHSNISDIDFSIYPKKTLIYFDPPYVFETCSFYNNTDYDVYESILQLFQTYNCILVHSHNSLLHYILKDKLLMSYDVKYGNTSNKRLHDVYINK